MSSHNNPNSNNYHSYNPSHGNQSYSSQRNSHSSSTQNIMSNYDTMARQTTQNNALSRQQKPLFDQKSFNNWIKSVLIKVYTEQMSQKVRRRLDLKIGSGGIGSGGNSGMGNNIGRGQYNRNNSSMNALSPRSLGPPQLLHILDIGCGRGQDIKKWAVAGVKYMVANDFSKDSLRQYQKRWQAQKKPYHLLTINTDFTSEDLYPQIQHSYYDIVSAQFCFHYMWASQVALKRGLASVLSNLLVDGCFIATIPDAYAILAKVKEHGVISQEDTIEDDDGQQQQDHQYGSYGNNNTHHKAVSPRKSYITIGNKYYSIRFDYDPTTKSVANTSSPYGCKYGFYLHDAVGSKDTTTGKISYTEEWLVSLDHLETQLKEQGMVIESSMNFLEFYMKYRQEYKQLFRNFKLAYSPPNGIKDQLWEISHLYRVVVARKVTNGRTIGEFGMEERRTSMKENVGDGRYSKHYANNSSSSGNYNNPSNPTGNGRSQHHITSNNNAYHDPWSGSGSRDNSNSTYGNRKRDHRNQGGYGSTQKKFQS